MVRRTVSTVFLESSFIFKREFLLYIFPLLSGFHLVDPSLLPPNRYYNKSRGSKVYLKSLGTQRDVDAEELLWNI